MHGVATARLLGSKSLYIPRLAGVFCAFGMCNSDLRHDHVRSWLQDLDSRTTCSTEILEGAFREMHEAAGKLLAREGFEGDKAVLQRAYDLRYFGQQWTVAVECSSTDPTAIRAAFEKVFERLFGYVQTAGSIEVVNLRLAAIGKLDALKVAPVPSTVSDPLPHSRRRVWIGRETGFADIPIYDGTKLTPRQQMVGPAVVEEATTTIFIGLGDRLTITDAGNYHVRLAHAEEVA
ncbi:hypothetical protein [Bradyrhizobium sp. ISRA463]|uniref:hypothetical protein n=1 Tax=Bradyrhizobium sp. ISRA463 TaxID=2866199 RepID=UPI00247921EE|nr:hypothetical protein [Bradyrhizobium sp. ISRA463]WGS24017.1 hypothetical protein MTX22_32965 [Bradyrhizobium sp. ISRA463]